MLKHLIGRKPDGLYAHDSLIVVTTLIPLGVMAGLALVLILYSQW